MFKLTLNTKFLTALLVFVKTSFLLMNASVANANNEQSFKFTTATGRAAITQNVTEEIGRLRALEDALYLAALQGGADINGFTSVSTDTSLQDHFVIRPSSKILDYTILSENKSDSQIEVIIRAAVGNLPPKKCQSSRPLNFTLYRPTTSIDMNVPAWIEIYHSKLFNEILFLLNNNTRLSVNNAMNVVLSPKKLGNIDERYDYASLISPQIRVRKGDFAVVPTLSISTRNTATRFSNSNNIEIKLGLNVFKGETYELIEKFEEFKTFENDKITVFQTLADLDKKSREDLINTMRSLVEPLISEMTETLGCQTLKDTLFFNSEQLLAQIGYNQGIKTNMLAVTSGKHTPWTMLRVVSASANASVLEPLDKARELSELDGKTVEFMELN